MKTYTVTVLETGNCNRINADDFSVIDECVFFFNFTDDGKKKTVAYFPANAVGVELVR